VRSVLTSRDLWLLSLAAARLRGDADRVDVVTSSLYLQGVVGLTLLGGQPLLALAQFGGMLGRVLFGMLSDRLFGGRRRHAAGPGRLSARPRARRHRLHRRRRLAARLARCARSSASSGSAGTACSTRWMAELAGPGRAGTAVGLGLAVSSAGVTLGPLLFGYSCSAGGYRGRGSRWRPHGGGLGSCSGPGAPAPA
jgi:hypothetical protein